MANVHEVLDPRNLLRLQESDRIGAGLGRRPARVTRAGHRAPVRLPSGDPLRDYSLGGTQLAFEAIESMRRQLSTELGPHGVRFVTLRTGGVPASLEGLPAAAYEEIVKGMEEQTLTGRAATLEEGKTLVRSMLALEIPIVGAVNGPAVGLGCSLASLCDLVLMAEDAYFADPHVVLGLVAGDGGAHSLPRE